LHCNISSGLLVLIVQQIYTSVGEKYNNMLQGLDIMAIETKICHLGCLEALTAQLSHETTKLDAIVVCRNGAMKDICVVLAPAWIVFMELVAAFP